MRWISSGSGAPSPAPEPRPNERVELTHAGMQVLWQSRVDQVDRIIRDAQLAYGNGRYPADVLLDIALALHPQPLRPAVPVVPGPDGAAAP